MLNFRDAVDFTAYSKDRLVGSWAELCGITYALDTGNSTSNITLTQEQILEYDPDYIFFTSPAMRRSCWLMKDSSPLPRCSKGMCTTYLP